MRTGRGVQCSVAWLLYSEGSTRWVSWSLAVPERQAHSTLSPSDGTNTGEKQITNTTGQSQALGPTPSLSVRGHTPVWSVGREGNW